MTRPVGRNSPPTEHQFKPGQSGNPRGRPKGSPNEKTIVQMIARETHDVTIGGQTRRLNTVELLLHTLMIEAMSGNIQAEKQFEQFRDRFMPDPGTCGYLVVPEQISPEAWVEREEKRNQLRKPPPGCRDLELE